MEKCESDLQTSLKNENLNIDERKKIASGFQYLGKIGIEHNVIYGRKLSNFLLKGSPPPRFVELWVPKALELAGGFC